MHKSEFPPLGLLGHQREIGGPKSLCKPSVCVKGEAAPGPSQGSVDTVGAGPSSGRGKPRRQSGSMSGRPNRSSPLVSSSGRQPTAATSQVLEVAEASLVDAMSKVPSSYEPHKKADFKHINAVYKKF